MKELEERLAAINELKAMSRDDLEKVPHDIVHWGCQGKGCTNGTKVWDFGISPIFYHPRKNLGWVDLTQTWWMCGKHVKMEKRLLKSFSYAHVSGKLWDFSVQPFDRITKIPQVKKPLG